MKRFTKVLATGLMIIAAPALAQHYSFTNYVIPLTASADPGVITTHVNSITQDARGHLWFGCGFDDRGAALKFDGEQWMIFTAADGLAGNCVRDIVVDAHDFIWFATSGGISGGEQDNIFLQLTPDDGLVSLRVSSIDIDADSNIWFGCGELALTGGISILDGNEWEWTNYTADNGLAGTWVTDIAHDREGHIWVGYYGYDGEVAGVSMFDGEEWTGYTPHDGLADKTVWSIAIDQEGSKWFGTSGGVSHYDGSDWTTYTMLDGLAGNRVNAIEIDQQGDIWFGTHKGVTRFDGTEWTSYTTVDGLLHNNVRTILSDRSGDLWFGTDAGISRLNYHHTAIHGSEEEDALLRIYPNPGTGLFTIEPVSREPAELEIYDMQGRLVLTKKLLTFPAQADLHVHPAGIYLFRLRQSGVESVSRLVLK